MKLIEHPNVLRLYDVYENKKYLLVVQFIVYFYKLNPLVSKIMFLIK